jgi:hypothetical protein
MDFKSTALINSIKNINPISFIIFIGAVLSGEVVIYNLFTQTEIPKIALTIIYLPIKFFSFWVGFRLLYGLKLFPEESIHAHSFLGNCLLIFIIYIGYVVPLVIFIAFYSISFGKDGIGAYFNPIEIFIGCLLIVLAFSARFFVIFFHGHKLPDIASNSSTSIKGEVSATKPIRLYIIFFSIFFGIFNIVTLIVFYQFGLISAIILSSIETLLTILTSWQLRAITSQKINAV